MRFHVRRAIPGDEPVLRKLRLQALADSPQAFGSTYQQELARTPEDWRRWLAPRVTFLLEANGEVRGLVAGVPDPQDSEVVDLRSMWVHPDQRGTGAADTLVSCVKSWASEVGAKRVRLQVFDNNGRARRCYERAGFRATDRPATVGQTGNLEIEMTWDAPKTDE